MTSLADTMPMRPWRMNPLHRRLACGAALVALGDFLFYGHAIGISLVIFLAALGAASALTNVSDVGRRKLGIATIVLVVSLLPLIEDVGAITVLLAAGGVASFVLIATRQAAVPLLRLISPMLLLYAAMPWQLIADLARERRIATQRKKIRFAPRRLIVWIVPVVCCGVFLTLLTVANPLIDLWIPKIDLSAILDALNVWRILFWLLLLTLVWPFLRVKLHRLPLFGPIAPSPDPALVAAGTVLLSPGAVLRSLTLFNILFAFETGLDAIYLWGGAALPNGMTYADYAHRGAYPLMATALLAAGFVLVALRPGSDAERHPIIRGLVTAWVIQNVLLVISAILRLDLYVAAYSLTLLRAAAFVWMLLVAIGLGLILLRIVIGQSNAWLIKVNVGAAAATLYVCGLTNFAAIVADYNVSHCQEISGQGAVLDVDYLTSLRPQALPAIDRYITQRRTSALTGQSAEALKRLVYSRNLASKFHRFYFSDWRAWSFRGARLSRYLQTVPDMAVISDPPPVQP